MSDDWFRFCNKELDSFIAFFPEKFFASDFAKSLKKRTSGRFGKLFNALFEDSAFRFTLAELEETKQITIVKKLARTSTMLSYDATIFEFDSPNDWRFDMATQNATVKEKHKGREFLSMNAGSTIGFNDLVIVDSSTLAVANTGGIAVSAH